MQGSPIGWVGGKRLLRREILKRLPVHTTYVDVFCGAAWVLFGKDRTTSRVEVANDIHCDLSNFFRVVREKPLELIAALRFRLISRDDFAREKEIWRSGNGQRSEIERAAAFFWVLKNSFGGKASPAASFGYSLTEGGSFRADLVQTIIEQAHERLKQVYVFNEDFERLIRRLDRPATFFYCDPPYWGAEGCYEHRFSAADHERLARTLKGIAGKFLLSYNDHDQIRNLYDWAIIEEVSTRYSLARDANERRSITELLIRNY
jgi:DNA adenine methylase